MRPGTAEFYDSCPFYAAREEYRLLTLQKILKRDWRIREFFRMGLPKGRLLDVGCGHGEVVRAASLMGYEAFGVDMDEKAIAVARRIGIPNVSVGMAEDCKEGPFQIITCLDVLEHLQDPVGVLSNFAKSLAPRGKVAISLPAWDRGPFLYCAGTDNPPHHLTMWTETAVKAFADRAGYTVEQMKRKPYHGEDFMVRCRHEWAWINRDIFPVKVLRRLLLPGFIVFGAALRVLCQYKGFSILGLLSPRETS
jgi:SAM-dependent methyltransferase